MRSHDAVMRELVILAAQHHRLFLSYSHLAAELRKCRSCCATVRGIEKGVSGANKSTDQIGRGEALSKVFE